MVVVFDSKFGYFERTVSGGPRGGSHFFIIFFEILRREGDEGEGGGHRTRIQYGGRDRIYFEVYRTNERFDRGESFFVYLLDILHREGGAYCTRVRGGRGGLEDRIHIGRTSGSIDVPYL